MTMFDLLYDNQNQDYYYLENDDAYLVSIDAPGIKTDSIDISYLDKKLTVSYEKDLPEEEKEKFGIKGKNFNRKFKRTYLLKTQADSTKISATYEDGVIKVVCPKTEEAKPIRIAITS